MNIFKPILISLSPNTSREDVLLAAKLIFRVDKWQSGKAIKNLEERFESYFNVKYAVSFNAGRSTLFAILKCLGIGEGDEILLQAYTCVAVPNAVLWSGAKPIFVDINEGTFNMDPEDLRLKITKRSRAIIVQHTFGQPADTEKILKVAQERNLWVVEDCAHALGAKYKGKKVGTLSKVAFFSFGRDKIISSVFGGMAITGDRELGEKLKAYQQGLKFPKRFFVFQQLLHPIAFSLILPFYNVFHLGKIILVFLQKIQLLSFPVFEEEKSGGRPEIFPNRLPNALAQLALSQFGRLEKILTYKKAIANFYVKNLKFRDINLPQVLEGAEPVFLRFTVRTKYARQIREYAKKKGILLGDWYEAVSPEGVNLKKVGYKRGSCPVAEEVATQSLNLPTHPKMNLDDAKQVVETIEGFYGNQRDRK